MWFGWSMFMGPLFLIGIAILIYYLVISSRKDHRYNYHRPYYRNQRAIEILKERYAKGEISKEQFKEMRRELEN